MKKTVMVKSSDTPNVEREVEFPIYKRHGVSDDTDIFTRVDADMTSFSIAVSSKRIEIDDDGKYKFGQSSADYDLGEGVYKSSEAEFRTAIVDAKEMLSKIERKAWG